MIEIIEEMGMAILNDNCEGDWRGEYTYISERCRTVIDYVICDSEFWANAENLRVESRADSDLCALVITVGGKVEDTTRRKKETKQVKDWTEKGLNEFKEKCAEINAIEWTELKERISEAVSRKTAEEKIFKEDWWDAECEKRKAELHYWKRKTKRGEATWEEFKARRRLYREMLANKKVKKGEQLIEEIEMDRSEKKFWEVINRNKIGRQGTHEGIKKEEWVEHFKKLLDGREIEEKTNEQEGEQSITVAEENTVVKLRGPPPLKIIS